LDSISEIAEFVTPMRQLVTSPNETKAVRLIDGRQKSLLRVFRIEQLWAPFINKINNLFGARKGLFALSNTVTMLRDRVKSAFSM